jgi:hypothetical protein
MTMKLSDEMLMAYADGELDLVARAEIEAAMARDPEVARAVERHRATAAQIRGAYDGVLAEPVPERLAALVAGKGDAPIVNLAARRSSRRLEAGPLRLPAWAAMAASLAVGLFVGMLVMREPAAPFASVDGALVARGELDAALDSQLASTSADASTVRVGFSFRNRAGDYCRTFQMQRDASLAGLACRSGEAWQLQVLAAAPAREGEVQPAAAMPIAVLRAVDAAIEGEPLDAAAETAARDTDWRNPRNMAE